MRNNTQHRRLSIGGGLTRWMYVVVVCDPSLLACTHTPPLRSNAVDV